MGADAASPAAGAQTLERGLLLLSELARHDAGVTTAALCAATGLHRSIAHRLLLSLVRTGFAVRDEQGRFGVGPAATALVPRNAPGLRDVARPVLRELAAAIDATAALVELVGEHAVTTVVAEPPTPGPRFSYRLGNHDPLDRGAGGLAVLASGPAMPDEPARVTRARVRGVITTRGELNPGAYGVAAPLVGWGVSAAITVVTNRRELASRAESLIVEHARRIDLHAPAAPAARVAPSGS